MVFKIFTERKSHMEKQFEVLEDWKRLIEDFKDGNINIVTYVKEMKKISKRMEDLGM